MLFKMKVTAAFSFVILGVILMLYLNTERTIVGFDRHD